MDPCVEVPIEHLSKEALRGIIEEFCTREGTDYGHYEFSFDDKIESVLKKLKNGQAKIYFNKNDETINILGSDQIN